MNCSHQNFKPSVSSEKFFMFVVVLVTRRVRAEIQILELCKVHNSTKSAPSDKRSLSSRNRNIHAFHLHGMTMQSRSYQFEPFACKQMTHEICQLAPLTDRFFCHELHWLSEIGSCATKTGATKIGPSPPCPAFQRQLVPKWKRRKSLDDETHPGDHMNSFSFELCEGA